MVFDDEIVLSEKCWPSEHNEAEKLQPEVDKLLKQNELTVDDIEKLIVCVGPGGFTSTRVGVSAVNAWAFAKNIPVAKVTVFDLFEKPETLIIISANPQEGWVKVPGKNPEFITKENFNWPKSFKFTGIVDDDWKNFLKDRDGKFISMTEQLPGVLKLEFSKQIVLPWYYKDPKITLSKKCFSFHP